jgi:hypothetical protein
VEVWALTSLIFLVVLMFGSVPLVVVLVVGMVVLVVVSLLDVLGLVLNTMVGGQSRIFELERKTGPHTSFHGFCSSPARQGWCPHDGSRCGSFGW